MNANWYGALPQWAQRRLPRIDALEGAFGVVGGEQEHHAAPFSITEEFASVYRLHPLIPDEYDVRSPRDRRAIAERGVQRAPGPRHARRHATQYGWSDLFYSFGIAHPGAITLHNHPRALQNLTRVNGRPRRHRRRSTSCATASAACPATTTSARSCAAAASRSSRISPQNKRWVEEIREVYEGDIDAIDLQVGLLAEKPPKGFGFSDTAFRIFILMASRRLKSDRFFTNDYTPEVYTQEGIDWIESSSMVDVLMRHHPELGPALEGCQNAFAPWRKLG